MLQGVPTYMIEKARVLLGDAASEEELTEFILNNAGKSDHISSSNSRCFAFLYLLISLLIIKLFLFIPVHRSAGRVLGGDCQQCDGSTASAFGAEPASACTIGTRFVGNVLVQDSG